MKLLLKSIFLILITAALSFSSYAQGVKISTGGGSPHESSILEVESTTQGLLIPRMTSAQRGLISNPQSGLLVFDTDQNAFFIYGSAKWVDLSMSSEIWSQSSSNVFLTNSLNNVGIGTNTPSGKFIIKADAAKAPDDVLFEIQDVAGEPIFVVTSEGARMYVKDYTTSKAVSGGFAVGRYGAAKGSDTLFFYTNKEGTKVFSEHIAKGVAGGFAVGRYGAAKGDEDYYAHIRNTNAFIGYSAGVNTTTGTENIFIGSNAGVNNTTGSNNVFIGNSSGSAATGLRMVGNVFIGNQAGAGETGDNKLYISNNSSGIDDALISGDFSTFAVNLNANLRFNRGGNTITMPTTRGTTNHVLTTNGGGGTNWINVNALVTKPLLVITTELQYVIEDPAITTLVNKATDIGDPAIVYLPKIEESEARIITVKNFMQGGEIKRLELYPAKDTEDLIEGSSNPLILNFGESYTLQSSKEDNSWYILNSYP